MARYEPGWKYDPYSERFIVQAANASEAFEEGIEKVPDDVEHAVTVEVEPMVDTDETDEYWVTVKHA